MCTLMRLFQTVINILDRNSVRVLLDALTNDYQLKSNPILQVCKLMLVNMLALTCVWSMQFYQSFIVSSLFVSFVPIACLVLQGLTNTSHSASVPSEAAGRASDNAASVDGGGVRSRRAVNKLIQSFAILIATVLATLFFNQALKVSHI